MAAHQNGRLTRVGAGATVRAIAVARSGYAPNDAAEGFLAAWLNQLPETQRVSNSINILFEYKGLYRWLVVRLNPGLEQHL
jgi:hypothetical protein